MNKLSKTFSYVLISFLIGGLVPLIFVYLDLSELEMSFNIKNLFWDINSQRILKFSVLAFPIIFAFAGFLFSRIAKQKQILENAKKYNETIFDIMSDLFFVLLPCGEVKTHNDLVRSELGYKNGSLFNKPIFDLIIDKEASAQIKEFIYEEATDTKSEILLKHSDGSELWYLCSIRKFTDPNTQKDLFFFQAKNIDQEFKLKEKLKREEADSKQNQHLASIGQMTSGIAHEINNPLAIINGYSIIMERMISGEEEIDRELLKQKIETVKETCHRISKIIRSMQDISRDTTGEEPRATSLKEVIGDVIEIFQEKIKGTEIDLQIDLDSGPFSKEINLRRISVSRVFVNLINNAIDAVTTLEEKWITVTVEDLDTLLKITITDSGAGIPKEHVDKIFEPFFTSKDIGKGTGLGLSLSNKVVKGEGGKLYVDEECPHTRFIIELPVK